MSETTEDPSAQSAAYIQSLDRLREQYNALITEWDNLAQSVFQSSFSVPQNGSAASGSAASGPPGGQNRKQHNDHLLHEEKALSSADSDENVEYSWTSHRRQEREEQVEQQKTSEASTTTPATSGSIRKDDGRTLHPDDSEFLSAIVSNHPAVELAISKLSDLRLYWYVNA